MEKAKHDELVELLSHKWKLQHLNTDKQQHYNYSCNNNNNSDYYNGGNRCCYYRYLIPVLYRMLTPMVPTRIVF